MRLITGPAGSGKTTYILERLREALRARNQSVRLLVPTSTMAQHLQNQVAREGFVFRCNLIQTLSRFVEERVADFPQATDPVLYLLVEEAVARVNRPEFRRVARLPGFSASLARTIAEFSSAGCDSARLGASLPDAPLAAAFLAAYEELDRLLDRRGLLLRSKRLECAAARIDADGLAGITTIWLDGFHALPDPELAVIQALGRHADLTVTLGDGEATAATRTRLLAMGFQEQRAARKRPAAARALVRARSIEQEVEEIARRIIEQAAAGRPFREIGIIVRSAEIYVPLLRVTLERFRIPARFYFDSDATQHPVTRFLSGAIDAMLSGWDHAATLAALRLAPRFADSTALDRFDFAVRDQIPNSGLGALKAFAGNTESPLSHVLDALGTLEEWRSFEMKPADWAARFRTLRNVFRHAKPIGAEGHEQAHVWRSQAAALDLFDEALQEAAQALDPEQLLDIAAYWRAVESVLRLKPLRLEDGRRNVVHVLSAHEARQWVLPVVFVCGMVEKQFPRFHPQDPFFPDSARCELNAASVRVRTAEEFEREEQALFEATLSRATMLVTLSYPELNARGERNLPSLFLENLFLEAQDARLVRPQPRHGKSTAAFPAIRTPALLDILKQRTAKLSPTGIESFLQCPYQYFSLRLLRLRTAPLRPEERLDFQQQGKIVHQVLAEWAVEPQAIGSLFERIFARVCEENRILNGYHRERLRNAMLEDLERYESDPARPRPAADSRTELPFVFALDDSLAVSGRIDRMDTTPDGRVEIIDYKYSGAQRFKRLKSGDGLQAPLYVLAAERAFGVRPAAMSFVRLKGDIESMEWREEAFPPEWQGIGERVLGIAAALRGGGIGPAPADREDCRFCDARDVCRIEVMRPAVRGEGA